MPLEGNRSSRGIEPHWHQTGPQALASVSGNQNHAVPPCRSSDDDDDDDSKISQKLSKCVNNELGVHHVQCTSKNDPSMYGTTFVTVEGWLPWSCKVSSMLHGGKHGANNHRCRLAVVVLHMEDRRLPNAIAALIRYELAGYTFEVPWAEF